MSGLFAEKVAVVTGASSGIGRATALALASAGAHVVAVGRRQAPLDDVVREIEAGGGVARAIAADVTCEDDRVRLVAAVEASGGGLDVLVNAAGVIGFGTIDDTTLDAWQRMFDINVTAVYRLLQLFVPQLALRRGNVVTVSSVNGLRSFPGVLAYCASKSAVDQLTRCAALELAARGVRVNSVNPGVVQTNLHKEAGLDAAAYAAFLERSKTTHPLGRVGTAAEVADLIVFLASSKAGWITGTTMSIDGGRADTCLR